MKNNPKLKRKSLNVAHDNKNLRTVWNEHDVNVRFSGKNRRQSVLAKAILALLAAKSEK
jgi:hypothetical protein